jgi:hypothetical protein
MSHLCNEEEIVETAINAVNGRFQINGFFKPI